MFDVQIGSNGSVKLVGRLDAAQAERAQKILRELPGPVSADCSELDYVSSAGITVLLDLHRRLTTAGQALTLTGMSPRVRTVFIYTGLDKILAIE
jgi:anti-anti-sigma factor